MVLVYGTTLQLPGEYFNNNSGDSADLSISNYMDKLKSLMQRFKAIPARATTNRNTYVSNNLLDCSRVFVRHDAIRKPLQQPYNGPFPMIKCTDKHFTIQRNNRDEVVSIDRLKPDYMNAVPSTTATIPEIAPPLPHSMTPRTTRSGRHVRWPKHLY